MIGRYLTGGLAVIFALFAGGFVWFATAVSGTGRLDGAKADAIVVVTGKEPRIGHAINLLARGHGARLLISGVHVGTTKSDLRRRFKGQDALFGCCVDLDRKAMTTRGNARQTALWTRAHGFSSLVLVTSSYHMPRALLEFSNAMPDVVVIADRVQMGPANAGRWWTRPATIKLLASEYSKILIAFAQIHAPGR